MTILKIDDNDTLWHYYKKSYTLAGEEVESPKNLCSYFWTSVWGAYSSLCMESPIYMQWLMVLCFVGLDAFMFTGAFMLGSLPMVLVAAMLFIMTFIMTMFSMAYTHMRWSERMQKIADYALGVLAVVVGSLAFGYAAGKASMQIMEEIARYGLWPTVLYFLGCFLAFGGGLIAFFLAFAGLILGIAYVCNDTPFARLLSQVGAVFSAWKQQVCPLVEAPESFYVEQGSKE